MFHITFALIPYFDWLLGPQIGKFSKIILQNLLFRNCVGYEAHLPSSSLYKTLSCVCSSQIRTLVATATFSFHRFIMRKVKILYFCSLIGDLLFRNCLGYEADTLHTSS